MVTIIASSHGEVKIDAYGLVVSISRGESCSCPPGECWLDGLAQGLTRFDVGEWKKTYGVDRWEEHRAIGNGY